MLHEKGQSQKVAYCVNYITDLKEQNYGDGEQILVCKGLEIGWGCWGDVLIHDCKKGWCEGALW